MDFNLPYSIPDNLFSSQQLKPPSINIEIVNENQITYNSTPQQLSAFVSKSIVDLIGQELINKGISSQENKKEKVQEIVTEPAVKSI